MEATCPNWGGLSWNVGDHPPKCCQVLFSACSQMRAWGQGEKAPGGNTSFFLAILILRATYTMDGHCICWPTVHVVLMDTYLASPWFCSGTWHFPLCPHLPTGDKSRQIRLPKCTSRTHHLEFLYRSVLLGPRRWGWLATTPCSSHCDLWESLYVSGSSFTGPSRCREPLSAWCSKQANFCQHRQARS